MMKIKIAHLIHDEKFPDSAYAQFEAVVPGAGDFYIASKNKKLKYIKKIKPIFVSRFSYLSKSFIKKISGYDLLILHSLTPFNIEVLTRVNKCNLRPKIIWIGMGYDYYDLIYSNKNSLFLDDTEALYKKIGMNLNSSPKRKVIDLAKEIVKKIICSNIEKKDVLKKIDYFSPVLPSEYEMVKNQCGVDSFPVYVRWNYGANAKFFSDKESFLVDRSKKNILLGNSATFTNNHTEIINFLAKHTDKFEGVLCPLNYGDEVYGNYIKNLGAELFEHNFDPMTEFVPYEDYLKKIQTCSVVIMNHVRQQAGGNIAAMLFMGATVFLREENPFYSFYKSQGVRLFSVQALEVNSDLLTYRLTDEEVWGNKKILKFNGDWESSLAKTRNLIQTVVR